MQTTKSADEEAKPETRKSKNYQEKEQKRDESSIMHHMSSREMKLRNAVALYEGSVGCRSVAVADARFSRTAAVEDAPQ